MWVILRIFRSTYIAFSEVYFYNALCYFYNALYTTLLIDRTVPYCFSSDPRNCRVPTQNAIIKLLCDENLSIFTTRKYFQAAKY